MCTKSREDLADKGYNVAGLDEASLPEIALSEMPEFAAARPKLQDITELRVEGDRASATLVSINAKGETDSATVDFVRENGAWTFCSD